MAGQGRANDLHIPLQCSTAQHPQKSATTRACDHHHGRFEGMAFPCKHVCKVGCSFAMMLHALHLCKTAFPPPACSSSQLHPPGFWIQVKPGVEHAHVIMNLLIDQGGIERIGLAENANAGNDILYNNSLWHNLAKIFCNDDDGPVEMVNRGSTTSIFSWPPNKRIPDPLLSMVRYPPDCSSVCMLACLPAAPQLLCWQWWPSLCSVYS